jgi:hypothetical protein
MKLFMRLTLRDVSADMLDAQIAFHLNAGVDFVVAAGEAGGREVKEVLSLYEGEGYLDREPITNRGGLVEADWLIESGTAEFWWPRGGSLKEVLASVPERYGDVKALVRDFVFLPDDGSFFADRMIERRPASDSSNLRSVVRVAHTVDGSKPVPLRAWYPIEVLSFPTSQGDYAPAGERLVNDTRLRDALRALRTPSEGERFALPVAGESRLTFPRPSVVDDAAYAVEIASLGEVDLAHVWEQVAQLEGRLAALEQAGLVGRVRGKVARRLKQLTQRTGAGAT